MELAQLAQASADTYRAVGDRYTWRKGRNSSRGYDALTVPSNAWDDRPHARYIALLDHHLSTAAQHLGASATCSRVASHGPTVTLAREVFVASSKASWLLDEGANWRQRAARAHLEFVANIDSYARGLPKRLESGYPNFHRRQWKESRGLWATEIIAPLFGRQALAGKRDEMKLDGEAFVTTAQLEARFDEQLGERIRPDASRHRLVPSLLVDPGIDLLVPLGEPLVCDAEVADHALGVAMESWLTALGAWLSYNAWDVTVVATLRQRLAVQRAS
jgi:hypothetical protein